MFLLDSLGIADGRQMMSNVHGKQVTAYGSDLCLPFESLLHPFHRTVTAADGGGWENGLLQL